MFMDVHEVMNGVGLHDRRFLMCLALNLSHAPHRWKMDGMEPIGKHALYRFL